MRTTPTHREPADRAAEKKSLSALGTYRSSASRGTHLDSKFTRLENHFHTAPTWAHVACELRNCVAILGLARAHGSSLVQALREGSGELVGHVLRNHERCRREFGILPKYQEPKGPPSDGDEAFRQAMGAAKIQRWRRMKPGELSAGGAMLVARRMSVVGT